MKLSRAERGRIFKREFAPLIREEKPDCEVGETLVLSWSRTRAVAVRDRLDPLRITGDVIQASKIPLLEITITDVRRRKQGGWRVRFDIVDRRESRRLVRRKPPGRTVEEYVEPTAEEVEKARIDSAYTSDPRVAVDHLEAVPEDVQNVLTMQAHSRFTEQRRADRFEETRKREMRAFTSAVKETATLMVRQGLDPTPMMGDMQRVMAAHQEQMKEAA